MPLAGDADAAVARAALGQAAQALAEAWPGQQWGLGAPVQERQGSTRRVDAPQALPFHNESLFLRTPPRALLLLCEAPGDEGGQTLLVRGDELLRRLDDGLRSRLLRERFVVRVGDFAWPRRLVQRHPATGQDVLTFCDPAVADDCRLETLDGSAAQDVVDGVRDALAGCAVHAHRWARGDLLAVDNLLCLHARQPWRGRRVLHRAVVGEHAALQEAR